MDRPNREDKRKIHTGEMVAMYDDKHYLQALEKYASTLEEQLLIQRVSNCKTEPKLNRLETELDKLQEVHGNITKHFELHSGCDSFKFKDGAVYRVKIERNQTKATLD